MGPFSVQVDELEPELELWSVSFVTRVDELGSDLVVGPVLAVGERMIDQ